MLSDFRPTAAQCPRCGLRFVFDPQRKPLPVKGLRLRFAEVLDGGRPQQPHFVPVDYAAKHRVAARRSPSHGRRPAANIASRPRRHFLTATWALGLSLAIGSLAYFAVVARVLHR